MKKEKGKMENNLELIERSKEFFTSTNQTNWGKNQIVEKIKDLKIEYLREIFKAQARMGEAE